MHRGPSDASAFTDFVGMNDASICIHMDSPASSQESFWPSLRRRVLIVAAHPDDETIAAGHLLSTLNDVWILHLTDGAPSDSRFIPPESRGNRGEYAKRRRQEAVRALACVGISQDRLHWAGVMDQMASYQLAPLARIVAQFIRRIEPTAIVTHPYEGGHPDHDAAAFATDLARTLVVRSGHRAPPSVEMASYHGQDGHFVAMRFLPVLSPKAKRPRSLSQPDGIAVFEHRLTPNEIAVKRRMFAAFATQRAALSRFPIDVERFRLAPTYDFSAPPHEGKLYYEQLGWSMIGAEWRTRAAKAVAELSWEGLSCAS